MEEELIVGCDGLVRAVHIRNVNGRTNKPTSKLCPLEVCSGTLYFSRSASSN